MLFHSGFAQATIVFFQSHIFILFVLISCSGDTKPNSTLFINCHFIRRLFYTTIYCCETTRFLAFFELKFPIYKFKTFQSWLKFYPLLKP